MKKRITSMLILVFSLVLVLAGCGNDKASNTQKQEKKIRGQKQYQERPKLVIRHMKNLKTAMILLLLALAELE